MTKVALVLVAVCAPAIAAADPDHEGLYFRIGVGPGFALGTLHSAMPDSTSKGVDISTELAVGMTVRSGLVIGVGTFPMVVPSPSYDGVDAGGQHVSATGPFADYYLHPAHGLHFQGGLLFGAGYIAGSGMRDGKIGLGYGATAGAGYDVAVTDRWTVGGLARVTAYHLYNVADDIRLVSPSLLLTATFH
jgi:hypothetical protein